jgi:LysR family hydrogen peroxide-inducible transcriptional activator
MVHRAHPQLRLLLRELTTDELLDALHTGEVDAAILSPPFPEAGLENLALYHEPFLAALPAGSRLAGRKRIALEALVDAGLLLLEEGHCLRDQALSVCGQAAGHNEEVKATSLEMLRQMVASGIGCTLLPALAASAPGVVDDARVAVRPLKTPVPGRDIVLAWRSRSVVEETVRGFGESLKTYLPDAVERT